MSWRDRPHIALSYLRVILPKVNYGQGNRAWNPSTRAEMYAQVKRAKSDPGFALLFLVDVLFSKSPTYQRFWRSTGKQFISAAEANRLRRARQEVPWEYVYESHEGRKLLARSIVDKYYYEYDHYWIPREILILEHTLNYAASWVGQAFHFPVLQESGAFYYAELAVRQHRKIDYTFIRRGAVSDAKLINKIRSGKGAFSGRGYDGVVAHLVYTDEYEPKVIPPSPPPSSTAPAGSSTGTADSKIKRKRSSDGVVIPPLKPGDVPTY